MIPHTEQSRQWFSGIETTGSVLPCRSLERMFQELSIDTSDLLALLLSCSCPSSKPKYFPKHERESRPAEYSVLPPFKERLRFVGWRDY